MKAKRTALTIVSLTAATANAQLRPAKQHFVVPAEQVAKAIVESFAERGIRVSNDQVKLPVDVLATEAEPAFEIGTVQSLGQPGAKMSGQASASVRVRCKSALTCMPFYAVVTWQGEQDSLAPAHMAAAKLAQAADTLPAEIVKAGTRLTLFMEAEHARIQMEVISLGSAALGQQLRVSTLDHKHIYTAEVLAANLVRGSF